MVITPISVAVKVMGKVVVAPLSVAGKAAVVPLSVGGMMAVAHHIILYLVHLALL